MKSQISYISINARNPDARITTPIPNRKSSPLNNPKIPNAVTRIPTRNTAPAIYSWNISPNTAAPMVTPIKVRTILFNSMVSLCHAVQGFAEILHVYVDVYQFFFEHGQRDDIIIGYYVAEIQSDFPIFITVHRKRVMEDFVSFS